LENEEKQSLVGLATCWMVHKYGSFLSFLTKNILNIKDVNEITAVTKIRRSHWKKYSILFAIHIEKKFYGNKKVWKQKRV